MWGVITGAGRGLGRGIALGLADRGYSLLIHGRDSNQLDETAKLAEQKGVKVERVYGDLIDPLVVESLIERAKLLDAELIVNNAGISCPGKSLTDLSITEVTDLLNVNLEVPIKIIHALMPQLRAKSRGVVVNINSMVGIEPKLHRSIYSAVRFGLRGFTEALALEAKSYGVKVLGVYPTRIKSRPEYEYGFEVADVVSRILSSIDSGTETALILDGRPR